MARHFQFALALSCWAFTATEAFALGSDHPKGPVDGNELWPEEPESSGQSTGPRPRLLGQRDRRLLLQRRQQGVQPVRGQATAS